MFNVCPVHRAFGTLDGPAICVKYDLGDVYFLMSERGNSVEVHIAAIGRKGKQLSREAGRCFLAWIKKTFAYEMVIATVRKKSVYNLCKKLGFSDLGIARFEDGWATIMVIDHG